MATDWARHGLQVNAIAPGYFRTPLNQALVDDPAFSAWLAKRTPAGAGARSASSSAPPSSSPPTPPPSSTATRSTSTAASPRASDTAPACGRGASRVGRAGHGNRYRAWPIIGGAVTLVGPLPARHHPVLPRRGFGADATDRGSDDLFVYTMSGADVREPGSWPNRDAPTATRNPSAVRARTRAAPSSRHRLRRDERRPLAARASRKRATTSSDYVHVTDIGMRFVQRRKLLVDAASRQGQTAPARSVVEPPVDFYLRESGHSRSAASTLQRPGAQRVLVLDVRLGRAHEPADRHLPVALGIAERPAAARLQLVPQRRPTRKCSAPPTKKAKARPSSGAPPAEQPVDRRPSPSGANTSA